jgi:predicted nucleic acid-binding protein
VAVFFFDSSALVKRYIDEAGSAFVIGLTDRADIDTILIARITQVEVIAAIFRRSRAGSLIVKDADAAITTFRRDLLESYNFIEISPELLDEAAALVMSHGLRGYDAVQLSAAVAANTELLRSDLPPLIVVSADLHLNIAAAAEGLAVENPNDRS